jgi:hypothetical protein
LDLAGEEKYRPLTMVSKLYSVLKEEWIRAIEGEEIPHQVDMGEPVG